VLRKLRDSDTAVKSGISILDVDYHPASFRLGTAVSGPPVVSVFHWDDEVLADTTLVMRLNVTKRVYDNVKNAIGHLRVSTFSER